MTINPDIHNQMISRLHENAMNGGCNDGNEDHNLIMEMLQRRVATGEGAMCGGWNKGQVISKAKYVSMMKARGKTKKQAEDMYKLLQAKRRAEGKRVNKGVARALPVRRAAKVQAVKAPTAFKNWNQFRAQYKGRKCNPKQLSDLYAQSKGIPRAVRPGPASCFLDAPATLAVLDEATEILSAIRNQDGTIPSDVAEAVKTLDTVKVITTKQNDPFELVNFTEPLQYIGKSGKVLPSKKVEQILNFERKRDAESNADRKRNWQFMIDNIIEAGDMDNYYDIY